MSFDVDASVRRGGREIRVVISSDAHVTALVGPSGVGKSTAIAMIAGLLRPEIGHIVVEEKVLFDDQAGIDVAPEKRRAGVVFQDMRLFPHLSVRANLAYGLNRVGKAPAMPLDEMADFLGISSLLDRRPASLSGGEARRVAIGRALLSAPRFLLLDEPLASLDRARAEEVMGLIERIRDTLALPMLLVSHDRAEIDRLAGTVVEIN